MTMVDRRRYWLMAPGNASTSGSGDSTVVGRYALITAVTAAVAAIAVPSEAADCQSRYGPTEHELVALRTTAD